MKKATTLLTIFIFSMAVATLHAQVLLARWTFPTGNPTDSLADGGLPVNLTMAIHTEGGTSAIDFSKNGATTKAAQATGWDDGAMSKCWVIRVNTTWYENLKLSSKQQTGGNNPGPRDFIVQYRIGTTGTWTDVPNSTMVTANNWTSAVLDSIELPEACENQPSLYLRWLMTTNVNSAGGTVESTGINKIDDIYVTGKLSSTAAGDHGARASFSVSPNPSNGQFTITTPEQISTIEFIDLHGRTVYTARDVNRTTATFNPGSLTKGVYVVRIRNISGHTGVKRVIVF